MGNKERMEQYSKEYGDRKMPDDIVANDRMWKWFEYDHLPEELRKVSLQFSSLASLIVLTIEPGPERTVALRKLLEAKDAAVRAVVHPGG